MSMWDVQRRVDNGEIIAIRPAGFKGWGKKDGLGNLRIRQEELSLSYFDKVDISREKGGDGLTKSYKVVNAEEAAKVMAELAAEGALEAAPMKAEVLKVLTVAEMEAEIARRTGVDPKELG